MKAFPWILAAVGLGVAAYVVANTPGPEYSTGNDSIEDAARKTARWGSKSRLSGVGGNIAGKLKEGVGNLTGNADLANQGAVDQVAGSLKDAAGTVAQAAGKTLHDFNR
ncbi:MAG: CsbD family protein [Acidobacteriaceae bacterium]